MGSFSEHDRQLAKRLQHGRCFVCYEELGDDFEVHAVIPDLLATAQWMPKCFQPSASHG